MCLSVRLFVYLKESVHLFVCQFDCSSNIEVCLSICLSLSLIVHLPLCLSEFHSLATQRASKGRRSRPICEFIKIPHFVGSKNYDTLCLLMKKVKCLQKSSNSNGDHLGIKKSTSPFCTYWIKGAKYISKPSIWGTFEGPSPRTENYLINVT